MMKSTPTLVASSKPFSRSGLARCLRLSALLLPLAAQAGGVDKLHQFLDSTRSFRAEFLQTVVAKNGRKPQLSAGLMLFSRPGKFRWQVEKPYPQLMVGDGEKFWIYDPELKQVTVKKMGKALGATPAALLAGEPGKGNSTLEKNFSLKDGGEHDSLDWVEATPKSADSGFEKVRLGFQGDVLKAMELQDAFGQTTTLVFQRVERNPALAPGLFHFTPPPGADVAGE